MNEFHFGIVLSMMYMVPLKEVWIFCDPVRHACYNSFLEERKSNEVSDPTYLLYNTTKLQTALFIILVMPLLPFDLPPSCFLLSKTVVVMMSLCHPSYWMMMCVILLCMTRGTNVAIMQNSMHKCTPFVPRIVPRQRETLVHSIQEGYTTINHSHLYKTCALYESHEIVMWLWLLEKQNWVLPVWPPRVTSEQYIVVHQRPIWWAKDIF